MQIEGFSALFPTNSMLSFADSLTATRNNTILGACSVDLQLAGQLLSEFAEDEQNQLRFFSFEKQLPSNQLGDSITRINACP